MNTEIKIFDNPQFGKVRTATSENGEPLFCLIDICRVLGLQTNKVKNRLDPKGWCTIPSPTNGGIQDLTYVIEKNFYKCVFQSRKPEAEQFTDYVAGVILPALRKTGGYIATTEDDTPETIMARALLVAKDTLDRQSRKIEEQNKVIADQAEEKEIISRQLTSAQESLVRVAPKVEYFNTVLQSKGTYTTTQIAKELGMSATKLNRILNAYNIQFKQSGQWMLYSKYQDKELTATRTFVRTDEAGESKGYPETVWTEKGRRAIHAKLNGSLHKQYQLASKL